MTELIAWRIAGSYFETCNWMAVCPCRRQNGKPGGDIFFTANIAKVIAVRAAEISLDHRRVRERVRIEAFATAEVSGAADFEGEVSCGIPGHHHPGVEEIAASAVKDGPLDWSYEGRSAFATEFAHHA